MTSDLCEFSSKMVFHLCVYRYVGFCDSQIILGANGFGIRLPDEVIAAVDEVC